MKQFFLIFFALLLLQACKPSQSIFELSPNQSMSITGKGPGQDAAFNPYLGQSSIGIVKNLGESSFTIRIQKDGAIIEQIVIKPSEKKEIKLLEGYELYLDSEKVSKARVQFKPYRM